MRTQVRVVHLDICWLKFLHLKRSLLTGSEPKLASRTRLSEDIRGDEGMQRQAMTGIFWDGEEASAADEA